MVQHKSLTNITLAALHGTLLWEPVPPIDDNGNLTSSSHPWVRLFYADLSNLAQHNRQFSIDWSRDKWWSIFADSFQYVNTNKLKSYVDNDCISPLSSKHILLCSSTSFKPLQDKKESVSADTLSHAIAAGDAATVPVDNWMTLEPAKQHASETAKHEKQKKYGKGSSKSSSVLAASSAPTKLTKAERLLIKGYIDHDTRLRSLEGIVRDGLKVPVEADEVVAGVGSGIDYAETVARPGQQKGPPFVYAWSAVVKVIFRKTDNPALRDALKKHMIEFNDHNKMLRVVRHCTMHIQRNQKWASFIIAVHSSIEPLWKMIRNHLVSIGAQEFDSPIPPRGPIIRQIRALAAGEPEL